MSESEETADDESENRAAGWILFSLILALFLALALLLARVGDDDGNGSGADGGASASAGQVEPAFLEAEVVDGVLVISGAVPDEGAADALVAALGPA
ncbi:MAG: hypothetical protein GY929_09080, partial [Actinomycetia bacterium]|nr:hypothetical protein [Actinomycetes bacterium]